MENLNVFSKMLEQEAVKTSIQTNEQEDTVEKIDEDCTILDIVDQFLQELVFCLIYRKVNKMIETIYLSEEANQKLEMLKDYLHGVNEDLIEEYITTLLQYLNNREYTNLKNKLSKRIASILQLIKEAYIGLDQNYQQDSQQDQTY